MFSGQERFKNGGDKLSKPLIGDSGRIYACSKNMLFAFENNGSIAWLLPLTFKCNMAKAPVHGGRGKILLIAENRVLQINIMKIGTSEPATQVLFDPGPGERGDEIVGIAYGYRQGCWKNVSDCYFASAPVIDQCEASIHCKISNSKGELYSLSIRSPQFNWIQDLSSFDKVYTFTPGNNGLLYVTVPVKSLTLALDISSGNVLWQTSIGPLSSTELSPVALFLSSLSKSDLQNFVVDEGMLLTFVTASKIGNQLPCRSKALKLASSCSQGTSKRLRVYTGNRSSIFLFLLLGSMLMVVLAAVVRFCCVFWRKKKLQDQGLGRFLEKRGSLQLKKKALDRTITEREQKATEEAVANEAIMEELEELVRERQGIERQLLTSYSLGRDETVSNLKSVLPLYSGRTGSYSFQRAKKESVTIFPTLSNTSSDESSSERDHVSDSEIEEELVDKAKAKAAIEDESSSE
ncbi:hypothetical protein V6N12_025546 [Hibiscus sabdariffa]|uniref:Protein GAMETE EXPRESSED 3 n=1 Tax=Hibiscus sabdariffa TaxID=183260 RepID=A0ABR2CJI4_9ROSI